MRDIATIIAENDGAAYRRIFREVTGREPDHKRMAGFLRCDAYTRDLRIRCLAGRARRRRYEETGRYA
jgi:hypothetical protein